MGEQKVHSFNNASQKASFIQHLLWDLEALERMLENQLFEKGVTRIGAEQEFCLVTKDWRPAKNADAILKRIDDTHFTTELAKYNLEINLDPIVLEGDCFQKVETQLKTLLEKAKTAAHQEESKVLLTGILPTISQNHLKLDYITERPRYLALNDRLMSLRGSHFYLHLMGVDELSIQHNSVLFEACNTSFQLHLQIDPDDFISSFNWAQAISGPVLASCANSPMLLGRELWSETRIALFRQSIDTRHISLALKDQLPRVSFGSKWASGSITEIYKDNISQYKPILASEIDENALETLQKGEIPKLKALGLHNGTIYPWNRACYGVGGGKPHLRIENRYIPSGPSITDEIANFAFWVGLMKGRPQKFDAMASVMDFKDAKANFIKAARYGTEAEMLWEGQLQPVKELIEVVFLPMARKGLQWVGIPEKTIQKYLGIIEKRIRTQTGSQWLVENFRNLKKTEKTDASLRWLTRETYKNQKNNLPVHEWGAVIPHKTLKDFTPFVGHVMSTRLLTVNKNDLASLATHIMQWNNIHHMPVEDENGNLCGLLTWRHVTKANLYHPDTSLLVKDIMVTNVITVEAQTPIKEAITLMKKQRIGCLPILQHNELIGIVTIKDVKEYDDA